jgi:hypothetical protein
MTDRVPTLLPGISAAERLRRSRIGAVICIGVIGIPTFALLVSLAIPWGRGRPAWLGVIVAICVVAFPIGAGVAARLNGLARARVRAEEAAGYTTSFSRQTGLPRLDPSTGQLTGTATSAPGQSLLGHVPGPSTRSRRITAVVFVFSALLVPGLLVIRLVASTDEFDREVSASLVAIVSAIVALSLLVTWAPAAARRRAADRRVAAWEAERPGDLVFDTLAPFDADHDSPDYFGVRSKPVQVAIAPSGVEVRGAELPGGSLVPWSQIDRVYRSTARVGIGRQRRTRFTLVLVIHGQRVALALPAAQVFSSASSRRSNAVLDATARYWTAAHPTP